MIDRLKEKINERFPHIKFDSDDGFKFWFFETYLPFLILIKMGLAEEQEETKCVGFDVRDLQLIKDLIIDWYTNRDLSK